MIKYYSIKIQIGDEDKMPYGTFSDIAELGKKGSLCFSKSGLRLSSYDLAERLVERYSLFLKNKYGNQTEIDISKNEYNATPVYGPKDKENIKNDSIYAEDLLKNQKPPKIKKEKIIENGWIIIVKKEGTDKAYTMPIKNKNLIEVTTNKSKAKIYQRLNAAENYAAKINKIKDFKAFIVEINNSDVRTKVRVS